MEMRKRNFCLYMCHLASNFLSVTMFYILDEIFTAQILLFCPQNP